MTQRTYNWKRYWIPRDGRLNFDSQGFLVPPAADADWAKHWPAGTVGFEELLKCPCLVLLGEPGIGKSTAIRQAAERTREIRGNNGVTILTRQLGAYTTDAFFVKDVFGCEVDPIIRTSFSRF